MIKCRAALGHHISVAPAYWHVCVARGSVLRSLPPSPLTSRLAAGSNVSVSVEVAAKESASRWRCSQGQGATVLQQEFQELQALWRCRNAEKGQDKMRAELTSRWQQWLNGHPCTNTATLEKAKKDKSHKQRGNVWFNNGHNPMQASLSLRKGDTDMNTMTATLNTHPLAVGSDGSTNILFFGRQGELSVLSGGP